LLAGHKIRAADMAALKVWLSVKRMAR